MFTKIYKKPISFSKKNFAVKLSTNLRIFYKFDVDFDKGFPGNVSALFSNLKFVILALFERKKNTEMS